MKAGAGASVAAGAPIIRAWQLLALLAALVVGLAHAGPALALKPITVTPDQDRIDITAVGDPYDNRGDNLQVETAPGVDGATGRMTVHAVTPGTSPNWIVFALQNQTDKPIERWLTAERYNVVGSGVAWPDLDARRIEAVTPSVGFVPERVKNDRADIFRLTIEPGQTITFVVELASDHFANIHLWKALEYEQKSRDRQLFNGIMLGITGLLAVFLTAVFAANHKMIFPSAALVTWCVLALLCVDFGFWHKLFQMRPEDNAQYRAAAEAAVAASLVIFLFTFLRVNLWHTFVRMLFAVWIVSQLAVIAAAILDPRLAATVARLSLGGIGLVGGALTLFLAVRGLDRALALLPTWILFLVWLFGASVTLTGRLSGEIPIAGLVAGLVLIVVLIGFTVTQFAFRSAEPFYGASPSEQQLRSTAIENAGVAVWEWIARRNEIRIDPIVEATLGLNGGVLSAKVDDFLGYVHPADKERVELLLQSTREKPGEQMRLDFRLRHADSSYRWFELEGASVPTSDRRAVRCVGLLREVTDEKRSQERLMHDAVHDSLTGLPNRALLLDRLGVTLVRAKSEPALRPVVIYCNLDRFKSVNSSFGLIVGDSLLLTVSRRLSRSLGPHDTLARVGGDQFALLLPAAAQDPRELARFTERVRHALRSPIKIAGQEIVLTASIGVAVFDGSQASGQDFLSEAEAAMHRAKRTGSDRVEIFRPEMRIDRDQRAVIAADLQRAIEARQLAILYQPVIALSTEELLGFEAIVRWDHPRLGQMSPAEFLPIAEETDLIVRLGSYVLGRAVADIGRWQKELPRPDDPLFVSVNVSSRALITPDLVQEIRHVLSRNVLERGSLRLELTESLVMENPEQATHVLDLLKDAGAGLAVDDFGGGYSSLSFLHRFPFDAIKVDRAIIRSSSGEGNGAVIVRSIVAMAHELGKRVIAEGVESSEDASLLRSIGCEMAQGLYYGEPMPDRDVVHLLRLIRKADRRMRRRGLVRGQSKKKAAEQAEATAAANGHDRTAPNGRDRTKPPLPAGPPMQPVFGSNGQPLVLPQVFRQRSPAGNARARLAGLAGGQGFRAPDAPPEPALQTMPPSPLRRAQGSTGGRPPLPASDRSAPPAGQGQVPPPLPHQMPFELNRAPVQAQVLAQTRPPRPRTRPPNLEVLPPAIKASLEKLAGKRGTDGDSPGPGDGSSSGGNGSGAARERKRSTS